MQLLVFSPETICAIFADSDDFWGVLSAELSLGGEALLFCGVVDISQKTLHKNLCVLCEWNELHLLK